jgi:F-type H+-transporting ATPase subunit b
MIGMTRIWPTLLAVSAAVGLLLAQPGVASAADPADELLRPRFDLGIWTIVVFVLLFLVLKKYAWGPMLEGLHRREETIKSAVEEAKRVREEAERQHAALKAELTKAYEEIPKIMEEARRDAQNLKEEMRSAAQAEIQTERQRLRREIELATDQALQKIWTEAVQLAAQISAKAIRRYLSEDDHRRLLDEALAEIRQTGRAS